MATLMQQLEQRGLEKGLQKGLKQGLEKGLEKSKMAIAKKMLQQGFDKTVICQLTEITTEQLEKLIK